MALFKSGNPAINEKILNNITLTGAEELMTINGAMRKFGLLLVMLIGAAAFTWGEFFKHGDVMPWMIGGAIGGSASSNGAARRPRGNSIARVVLV